MSDTPETDANIWSDSCEGILCKVVSAEFARRLERERDEARQLDNDQTNYHLKMLEYKRERDEAREALREIWQSGDAFLPHVDQSITDRWRKAAGWEEIK